MKNVLWLFLLFCVFLAWCENTSPSNNDVTVEDNVFTWLVFDSWAYEIKTLSLSWEELLVRAYENIVYVKSPVDVNYQSMNIYVPEQYFSWEEINGFSLETAPIFFPNKVWGYMSARPETLWDDSADFNNFLENIQSSWEQPHWMRGDFWRNKISVSLYALKDGYIVASAWARGRNLQSDDWKYIWKAPAWIIDLKAAIRYLKYNDSLIPWDSNRIISNWTSAGWAMSALLWSTANHPDYEPYLDAIWAAPATDDVYAVSSYCPITNLDNADKAYEWEFYWVDSFRKINANQLDYNLDRAVTGVESISKDEAEISKLLKDSFPFYVSTLGLVDSNWNLYSLNDDWEWNFKESIKLMLIDSFDEALQSGENLSGFDWLTIDDGKVVNIDFDAYVKNYLSRNKWIPAFDGLSLEAWENNLFWNEFTDNLHFTNFSYEHSLVSWDIASSDIVKLMNPMNYIPDSKTSISKYRRIRHWAKDADTSLAIPFILAEALSQWGNAEVDFKYPWNQWHGWDYDISELINWMNSITH